MTDPLRPYQLRSEWGRAQEIVSLLEVGDLIELKRFLPTSMPYVVSRSIECIITLNFEQSNDCGNLSTG